LSTFFGTNINKSLSTCPHTRNQDANSVQNHVHANTASIQPEENGMKSFFEKKIAAQIKTVSKHSKKKTWRQKGSEAKLKARYMNESYVSTLLMCKRHDEYDRGKKPICLGNCQHQCQKQFTFSELKTELAEWWGEESNSEKRTALLQQDVQTGFVLHEDGTSSQHYIIHKKHVCRNFYLRARGMHNQKLFSVEQDIKSNRCSILGSLSQEHGNSVKKTEKALRTCHLATWLRLFADHCGDRLPDEDVVVLPYRQILPIYEEYCDDISAGEGEFGVPVKKSYFYEMFNKLCVQLKLRLARNTGAFVVCTVCDAYHSRLRKVLTVRDRDAIKQMRRAHLNKQRTQREKYYKHKRKAIANPNQYLSIIMDGMDQKKTHLPVWSRYTKDESPMEQRVVGVMVHGIRNYAFVVDSTVPGGTNLMVDILLYVLKDLDSRNELPFLNPTMFLQVDNCGENKNKVMFAFLTHLVRLGIFEKIKVGFLMVGHTHEDIDQFFSVIAAHLKMPNVICPDLETFIAELQKAFKKAKHKPEVVQLHARSIFDYKSLYDPCIDTAIAYHQEPHQFKIKQHFTSTDCHVLVHYKNWSHSTCWLPADKNNKDIVCQELQVEAPAPKKARKMSRGKVSVGQHVYQANHRQETLALDSNDDFENTVLGQDEGEVVLTHSETPLKGILWLKSTPDIQNAPFLCFDSKVVQSNRCLVSSIVTEIFQKFSSKYREYFTQDVKQNWNSWLEKNLQFWDPSAKTVQSGHLSFPRPYDVRAAGYSANETIAEIEDSAMADLPDDVETLTHNSSLHGSFSKKNRLDIIRDYLSNVHSVHDDSVILTGLACIYQFEHIDGISGQQKEQIAVGIITQVHENLIDIQFCPPKGAKPQKGKRPDTLYQDINEDMNFNTSYRSKAGKKIECEDKNLERSVILAFNLELNSNGSFSKKPQRADSLYNASSYTVAASVIKKFYSSKKS
jgi:hypothetical protein